MRKYFHYIIRILFYFSLFISLVFIITKLNPSIGEDEPFTMALINHSYIKMLQISYLDVHPPLYYIVLKSFLILTTFWTRSILVKIVFAKLLSFIFLIITIIELFSLFKCLNIYVNYKIQVITYLLILSTINFSLQIRMYEMATALLSIELLYLIKFVKFHKNIYLMISIISGIATSYTHYFAAMFAGSLFLSFFIISLYHHHKNNSYKLLFSGIVFICLFLPCIKFAHRQLVYTESNSYSNMPQNFHAGENIFLEIFGSLSGTNFNNKLSLLFCLAISICIIYLTIIYWRKMTYMIRNLLIKLILSFIISLIFPVMFSILRHPIIQGRYFYPIISIYEFILIGIILVNLYKCCNIKMLCFVLLILMLGIGGKIKNQFIVTDIQSIQSYSILNDSNKNRIMIDSKYEKVNPLAMSVYDRNNKHSIYIRNYSIKKALGNNNKKLFYSNFSNLHPLK